MWGDEYPSRDAIWAAASGARTPGIPLRAGERLHVSGIPGTPDHVQLIVTEVVPPLADADDQSYIIKTRAVTEADAD